MTLADYDLVVIGACLAQLSFGPPEVRELGIAVGRPRDAVLLERLARPGGECVARRELDVVRTDLSDMTVPLAMFESEGGVKLLVGDGGQLLGAVRTAATKA